MSLNIRFIAAPFLPLTLCGCNLRPTAAPAISSGQAIHGNVHGGQQPINGSHVFLLAANNSGTGNASISLLTDVPGSTSLDTSGGATTGDYYVTSDSSGFFSISGDYTCTAGQQVYAYAVGGDPGDGPNSDVGLLAALGNCPGGNLAGQVPYVWINEVTTVAAAYAFAGFASDATHVSSSATPLAQVGIANAFANAARLAAISTGTANAAILPAVGGGTAPQSVTNLLSNILASCINSAGPSSSSCSTLFASAKSNGSSGTVASDTASVAINIAHNPLANVATLYGLATATPAFTPASPTQPADFTLTIVYSPSITAGTAPLLAADSDGSVVLLSGTKFSRYSSLGLASPSGATASVASPTSMGIDTLGDVWVADNGTGFGNTAGFEELSSTGSLLRTVFDPSLTGLVGIAIDPSSNVWSISNSHETVVASSSSGTLLPTSGTPVTEISSSYGGIAINPAGDLWLSTLNGTVHITGTSGSTLSQANITAAGGGQTGVAIDHSGNLWLTSGGICSCTILLNGSTGALISSSSGYTGGGQNLYAYHNSQIDGDGNVWNFQSSYGSISELSSSGAPLGGFLSTTLLASNSALVLDGSGNVWIATYQQYPSAKTELLELIGGAAPVVTPLAAATAANILGTRP